MSICFRHINIIIAHEKKLFIFASNGIKTFVKFIKKYICYIMRRSENYPDYCVFMFISDNFYKTHLFEYEYLLHEVGC